MWRGGEGSHQIINVKESQQKTEAVLLPRRVLIAAFVGKE